MYGRSLPDLKLLQGSGNQGAFIRFPDVSVLDDPAVTRYGSAKTHKAALPLPAVVARSLSRFQQQRPRRKA